MTSSRVNHGLRGVLMSGALALYLASTGISLAGTAFFDDFEDGNHADGNPVTWSRYLAPLDRGDVSVQNGSLVVTPPLDGPGPLQSFPNYWETDLVVEGQLYHDVNIHTQVRALDSSTNPYTVSICALDTYLSDASLGSSVCGILGKPLDRSFDLVLNIITVQGDSSISLLRREPTTLSHFENEINLRLVVQGDTVCFTAWPEGEPEPREPQLSSELPEHLWNQEGRVALFAGNEFTSVPVAFRFVNVTTGDGGVIAGLQAGDANMDLTFDQRDLVQVQIAGKYLSGNPSTWGEGDWNGAPGGSPGNPPPGNGVFDQLDLIAALGANVYLTGPYAAIQPSGKPNDEQTSVVYDPSTGQLAVDAPAGTQLTSLNIDSAAAIFTGAAALNLGGSFDNDSDNNVFKATFGSSFGSLSFGNIAQAGLSQDFVLNDLTVIGSLAGGGDLGNVDLIYVPEPATVLMLLAGLCGLAMSARLGGCAAGWLGGWVAGWLGGWG